MAVVGWCWVGLGWIVWCDTAFGGGDDGGDALSRNGLRWNFFCRVRGRDLPLPIGAAMVYFYRIDTMLHCTPYTQHL